METLVSGLGRSPFTIKPGDRLRSASHVKIQRATVESVGRPNIKGEIIITTDEDRHTFHPGQPVVFPRRANGLTKIHYEARPIITDVFIGDVIAPPAGWPGGEPDLESGRFITDIQPSRRFGGFIVSYRRTNGKPGGKMLVDLSDAFFYAGGYHELSAESGRDKPAFKQEPKTASGIYKNLVTGEEVRFRIPRKKGRPPQDYILMDSPGTTALQWEQWHLISGNRHPSDPRK